MKEISKIYAAWLSALLEGEGSFLLSTHSNGYQPMVIIAQKDPSILKFTQELTGVGYIQRHHSERVGGMYFWRLTKSSEIVQLMSYIEPYLVALRVREKAICVLVIAYFKMHSKRGRGARVSNEEQRERHKIYARYLKTKRNKWVEPRAVLMKSTS